MSTDFGQPHQSTETLQLLFSKNLNSELVKNETETILVTKKNHKPRWGLVVALGLFSIVLAVFLIVYAIIVIERGPFPANSSLYLINGFFFIGLGMGYLVCAYVIKNLEKKIRKLEEELYGQNTKTA